MRTLPLVIAVLALSTVASADSIVGSAGFDWQTWTSADVNQNGNPFWDGNSADSSGSYTIGDCLTSSAACAGQISDPPGEIPYWGSATGQADPSISFVNDSAGSDVILKLEVAGYASTNVFGWYDLANPNTLIVLLSGPDVSEATVYFDPSENYGFFLGVPNENQVWFTDSSLNQTGSGTPANTGEQHFAVFYEALGGATTYWIGMEDLKLASSDKDYQDMVVRVSSVPSSTSSVPVSAPEPSEFLTMVLVCALALLGRKWHRNGACAEPR